MKHSKQDMRTLKDNLSQRNLRFSKRRVARIQVPKPLEYLISNSTSQGLSLEKWWRRRRCHMQPHMLDDGLDKKSDLLHGVIGYRK